jgi:hypothetical protein
MRKVLSLLAVAAFVSGASLVVRADDGAEVTLEGMAQCGKCALGETKECQNVLIVKKDDKTTKYFMVMNEVAKKAHSDAGFCTAKKDEGPKVKVVAKCEEKDGKLMLTATSIEKVK